MLMRLRKGKAAAEAADTNDTDDAHATAGSGPVTSAVQKLEMSAVEQALEALHMGDYATARSLPGAVGAALAQLADKIETIGKKTLDNTVDISAPAGETVIAIASMADDLDGVSGNAGTISSAADELSMTFHSIAENSTEAAKDSETARKDAEQSIEQIDAAGRAMNEISSEVKGLTERLDVLQRAVDQIGEMAQTIEDISSQTNLLALNATIEAARAGEAGKGFAVVASEVKALSQQTANATEQIRDRTNVLTGEMSAMMTAMQKSAESVGNAETLVGEVSTRFHTVGTQISDVSGRISDMAAMLDQQKSAVDEISGAISSIANEAKRARSSSERIANFASQTGMLIGKQFAAVMDLKIAFEPLKRGKAEHMLYKKRLAEVVAGFREMDQKLFPAGEECGMMKWCEKHLDASQLESAEFKAMKEIHGRFHEEVRGCYTAHLNEDKQGAIAHFRKVGTLYDELLPAIDRLFDFLSANR